MKYFVFCFSILITLVCFLMGIRIILLYIRTGRWMRVKATIISKGIKVKPGNPHPGKANYVPDINYRYIMNGVEYIQVNIYLENLFGGNRSFTKESVQKMVEELPSDPYVWVNPEEPARSVMFRHGIFIYFLVLVFGGLSLIVGLIFLLG